MSVEQAWILKRASLTPNKIAFINLEVNEQWTYQQLVNKIAKRSRFFEEQNLKLGSRVVVFAKFSKIMKFSRESP